MKTLETTPGVIADPPPWVQTDAFSDSGIEYRVWFFTDNFAAREATDGLVRDRVWYALSRASSGSCSRSAPCTCIRCPRSRSATPTIAVSSIASTTSSARSTSSISLSAESHRSLAAAPRCVSSAPADHREAGRASVRSSSSSIAARSTWRSTRSRPRSRTAASPRRAASLRASSRWRGSDRQILRRNGPSRARPAPRRCARPRVCAHRGRSQGLPRRSFSVPGSSRRR